MKKLLQVKDESTNKNLNEIANNFRLTDVLPLGEDDYWYTEWPTDKEKPFIRPCKVSGVRRLYLYDIVSDSWHYISIT